MNKHTDKSIRSTAIILTAMILTVLAIGTICSYTGIFSLKVNGKDTPATKDYEQVLNIDDDCHLEEKDTLIDTSSPGDITESETGVLGETVEFTLDSSETTEASSESDFAAPQKVDGYEYYIRVNRAANCVTVYGIGTDDCYSVPLKAMICSTGTATPVGTFKTSDMYEWRLLEGNVYGQYAVRIYNSILFHSVPYYTKNKNDIEYMEYNKLGTKASLGCIRLKVEDAKWIYDNCPKGTIVEIYDDAENPGPLGKPGALKISVGCGWDPTDPDENNPWKHAVASLNGVEDHVVERGDINYDFMEGIKALDLNGSDITDSVNIYGNIDVNVPGEYTLTYTVADGIGNNISYLSTVTVVDTTLPEIISYPVNHLITLENGDIDDNFFLEGLAVNDSGAALDVYSVVTVEHEELHQGTNEIKYHIGDGYGNYIDIVQNVFMDTLAPEIILLEDKQIPETVTEVNYEYAKSRIISVIEENGIDAEGVNIKIVKINSTTYTITYSCTDFYGNTAEVSETLTK